MADVAGDIAKKATEAAFSEAERKIIEKYYKVTAPVRNKDNEEEKAEQNDEGRKNKENKSKNKGKGKKKKELPRGMVKKLERGGTLPPGHAKRYLPADLDKQLKSAPKGFERIEEDDRVILVETATGIITDVIKTIKKHRSSSEDVQKKTNTENIQNIPEPTERKEKKWWQIWKD
jgi:Ni/Co efflux regulator RcnB